MQHSTTALVGAAPITFETGKIARLADGAVTVRYGDTIILVSAVSATSVKEGQDWFPLTVEYREKAAAVGKIPGSYFRREGRPSEKEILTCRMTDRPLRPLFPKGYLYDTQIIATLLSADGENDSDMLAINGASAALCVSDIPFGGPVGAVRVGRVNGEFVVNPTHAQREFSDLDLVYVGTLRRDHHDRRRGQGIARGQVHRGAGVCPSARPEDHRGPARPRQARRQGKARHAAVLRARRDPGDRLPGGRRPHRGRHLQPDQDRPRQGRRRVEDRGEGSHPRQVSRTPRRSRFPRRSSTSRRRRSASPSSTSRSASTAAATSTSARCRRRSACCPARTARACSNVAKRRRSA